MGKDYISVTVVGSRGEDSAPAVISGRDLILRAKRDWRMVVSAESKLRQNQLDDKRFRASEQWDETSTNDRAADERPMLTINRLPQFIRQVTNAQRQANMAITVLPVGDGSDQDTAEVFQGIIKHIEDQSDAQVAYQTAGDDQATIGRGFWRIISEYTDEKSFTQELRIKRIRNAFSVYFDPSASEIDGRDARYAIVVEDMPKDVYIEKYGESSFASLSEFVSTGDDSVQDWMPEGKVRVAEYWYVDVTEDVIVLIQWPDGDQEVVSVKDFKDFPDQVKPFVKEIARRKVERRKVKVALINAVEILEGNEDKTEGREWPGKWIPIVPVLGDEIDINGEIDYRGMVRDAKDPQRMYNFQNTALVETLALAPLAQWVGYAGQFEGHEDKWNQANRRRFPYLEVNPFSLDGKTVPLPRRETAEPALNGINVAIRQADNDLKATMGIYDPSLGSRGNQDQSGKAIAALQKQGELANSNFADNMARAIRATGRILVDLIPYFYDAPRVIRIMGSDEQQKTVMVHAGADPNTLPPAGQLPEGVKGIYDLNAGTYAVVVATGPSQANRRLEAATALNAFVQAYPNAFPILGDLIVKNLDWPGSRAAAKRLHKMVPPQFLDPEDDGAPAPLPPQVQQEMAQTKQALQLAMQKLQEQEGIIKGKKLEVAGSLEEKKLDIASREKLAVIAAAAQLGIAGSKLDTEKAKAYVDAMEAKFETMAGIVADRQAQGHEASMEAMRQSHDLRTQHLAQGHDVALDQAGRADDAQQAELERQHQAEQATAQAERQKNDTSASNEK